MGREKVTEDQYNAKVAELYDLNKSKVPDNYYTYDEFVKLLKSGKQLSYNHKYQAISPIPVEIYMI